MASARIDREYAVLIMNCDRTCDLEPASLLFHDLSPRVNVHFLKWDLHERNEVIQQLCKRKLPDADLQNCQLLGVFVVHAHESRLNINEENSGVGYYKVFQALKSATEGHIIVVVQHDETYADGADESLLVSSTVRRKLLSQFSNEEMCGPQGYLFSWNDYPSEVHLEETVNFVSKRVAVSRKRREPKTLNPQTASSKRNNSTEIETKLPSADKRNKQNEISIVRSCCHPLEVNRHGQQKCRVTTPKKPSSSDEKSERQNSDPTRERSVLKTDSNTAGGKQNPTKPNSNTGGKQNPIKVDLASEQHRIIGDLTNNKVKEWLKKLFPKGEFVEMSAVYFIAPTNKIDLIRGSAEFATDWHLTNENGPVYATAQGKKCKTDRYVFALKAKDKVHVYYYSKKKSTVEKKLEDLTRKTKK